ncbi:hypothetical protein FNF28_04410 [Cafeteria roenbergensis]|uniref:C2 domain-containing protein n=1 Tax=Cafeteria roenbergensis TaxID=33653 RepID=A0A5A8DCY4_CAFRO|nr:hypothetical protein FNF28_04410 [Cafeteria roenbergensis]
MAESRVKLDVRVALLGCADLRKAETGFLAGKNDPFVKLSLLINGKKEGTRISPVIGSGGRDPRWNPPHGWKAAIETLQRTDPSDSVQLIFDVFDKNSLSADTRIGAVVIDVATLEAGRERKQFELEYEGKPAGKVDAIIELNVPVYAPGCAPGEAEAAAAAAAEAAAAVEAASAAAKAAAEQAFAEERAAAEAAAAAAAAAAAEAAAAEAAAAEVAAAEAAAAEAAAAKAAAEAAKEAEAGASAPTNGECGLGTPGSGAFSVGARVRVKPSVSSPKYGWGPVSAGDVGTIVGFDSDGDMKVNFPGKAASWTGFPSEMELVSGGAGAFSIGARVRVKPSVSSPKYGWGSVSAGDVGTVKSVESDSRMRVDFPGKNSNWLADPSEMELAPSGSGAFSVGARVRVKPSVSSPKYGWGSVSAGDVAL